MITPEEYYERYIYTECPYDRKKCSECWFDCDEEGAEEI